MLRDWNSLPECMKKEEVKKYYMDLAKKRPALPGKINRVSNIFLSKQRFRTQKSGEKFGPYRKVPYFCTRNHGDYSGLGYGVMVTLQILVLSFLVRVRVPQPKRAALQ